MRLSDERNKGVSYDCQGVLKHAGVNVNTDLSMLEVYAIEVSYNEIDRMCLEINFSIKKGLRRLFNWYIKRDFQRTDSYARSIGTNEYNKINIANRIV